MKLPDSLQTCAMCGKLVEPDMSKEEFVTKFRAAYPDVQIEDAKPSCGECAIKLDSSMVLPHPMDLYLQVRQTGIEKGWTLTAADLEHMGNLFAEERLCILYALLASVTTGLKPTIVAADLFNHWPLKPKEPWATKRLQLFSEAVGLDT